MAPAPMQVTTVRIPDPGPMAALPPRSDATLWLRHGDGMVAWGVAARMEINGPHRFAEAQRRWQRWTATTEIYDEVGQPGTGPVAFGSFSFDDDQGTSVLLVPRVLIGRRDGISWMTTIGVPPAPLVAPRLAQLPRANWHHDPAARGHWDRAVKEAVRHIELGEVRKVVLTRHTEATLSHPADSRTQAAVLAQRYPDCFTFSVDGLTGATPELLLRLTGRDVTSLVLAGTAWPGGPGPIHTDKNIAEHSYAAASALEVLRPLCSELHLPDQPELLSLPRLTHLATRITGVLRNRSSALELVGALHPTAAVGGTPTGRALALIRALEQTHRGRYAAPVGWQDAHGNGEWAIALRCADVKGVRLRLYAGCGIVAGSTAENEWQETEVKFSTMRDLFGTLAPAPQGAS